MSDAGNSLRERSGAGQPGLLLASLVLFIFLHPFAAGQTWVETAMEGVFTLVILASAWAVHGDRRLLLGLCVLGVPGLALHWATWLAGLPSWAANTAALLVAAFLLATVFSMVVFLFRARSVTATTLIRAMSAYLLLGIAFAPIYRTIQRVSVEAFTVSGALASGGPPAALGRTEALYFSFATLTTLGYGDITPMAPMARMVAAVEASMGPMYVAIVIARLVALYVRHSDQRPA